MTANLLDEVSAIQAKALEEQARLSMRWLMR